MLRGPPLCTTQCTWDHPSYWVPTSLLPDLKDFMIEPCNCTSTAHECTDGVLDSANESAMTTKMTWTNFQPQMNEDRHLA